MNWNEIEPKVNSLTQKILSVMDRIEQQTQGSAELPEISPSFINARTSVEHPCYDVVVCGEVKKGKSSLLNAIVGQVILPVDNEIATSQVFRISNSREESFHLVFTDGTSKQISREELSHYGSQIDANLQGEPIFKDHILSHIQVNIPIAFLPDGVCLVDTPGLGAMYKSHEWITQNYVKKASAVIFVMDPERPMVEKEKEFILKVLEVSRDIIFVMTKMDMYSEDVFSNILNRNEELLALVYSEKNLTAPKILPVSSAALMKVSTGKVEALKNANLRNSRFPQLKDRLLFLVYSSLGIHLTGAALRESADQIVKCKSLIEENLKVITAETIQEQQLIQSRKAERQSLISSQWGSESTKRRLVFDEINAICNDTRNRANMLFSIDGPVFKSYEKAIHGIETDERFKFVKENLGKAVSEELGQEWSRIIEDAKSRVNDQLATVATSLNSMNYDESPLQDISIQERNLSYMDYLPSIQKSFWVTTITITIVSIIASGWALILGLIFGGTIFKESRLQRQKESLLKGLADAFKDVRQKALIESMPGKNRSVVDEFVYELKNSTEEAIVNIFNQKEASYKKELAKLEENAKLEMSERQTEISRLSAMKNNWESIASEIKQLISERNGIAAEMGIHTK